MRSIVRSVRIAAGVMALCGSAFTPAMAAADLTKLQKAVDAMSQLDLIVFGDAKMAHDVEGKAWIGGNVSGTWNVGIGATGRDGTASNWSTLTVGGNQTGTVNIVNGQNGSLGPVSSAGNYGATIGGNAETLNFNDGNTATTVKIGGSVTGSNGIQALATGSSVAIGGTSTGITVGSNGIVQTGGSVNSLSLGQNSTARIMGDVGNGGQGNVNFSAGDKIYIQGQLQTQNLNGFGGTVETNGARWGQNQQNAAPADYKFNQTNSFSAPATVNVTAQNSSFVDQLTYLSAGVRSLTANKTITTDAVLSAADYGNKAYSVFSIADGASFFASGPNSDIATMFQNMGSKTVLLNVGGATINQSLNFNGAAWMDSTNIIWNFYEAKSVSLTGFQGTVLAPYATVSNSSAINGSVIANIFNQGGEVHLGTFDGDTSFLNAITISDPNVSPAVPEPATWATMILGFGIVGGAVRRRKGAAPITA